MKDKESSRLTLVVNNLDNFIDKNKEQDVDTVLDDLSIGIYAFMMGHYRRIWIINLTDISFESWQRVWMMAMEGLTLMQVEYGKQKISSGEFYPTVPPNPAQFRLLCKSMPEYLHFQTKSSIRIKYDKSPEADAKRREKTVKTSEYFTEIVKKNLETAYKERYLQHIEKIKSEQREQMEQMLREEEYLEPYD